MALGGEGEGKKGNPTAQTNIPHQCIVKLPTSNASLQKQFCAALFSQGLHNCIY
jgi:hypothetical protein